MENLKRKKSEFKGKDLILWGFSLLIIFSVVLGNLHFSSLNSSLRVSIILILVIFAIGLLRLTKKGTAAWVFIKESRAELRKVVWPTRQETLRTSFLIFIIVMLMSLILWGVDSLFSLLVSSVLM